MQPKNNTPFVSRHILFLAFFFINISVDAHTWHIHHNPDMVADFTSINAAMESVADGDTLYIDTGCMLSDNQTVNKQVTVIGTGFLPDRPNTASITGTLYINATARFESVSMSDIFIGADHVTIERCHTGHILWTKQGFYLTLRQSKVGRVLGSNSSLYTKKEWTYYATIENCIILFNWYFAPIENLEKATIHHNYVFNEWSGSNYLYTACLMYNVSNSKIHDNILLRSTRPNQIFDTNTCTGNTVYNNIISSTAKTYPSFPDNIYLESYDPSIVFSLTGEGDEQYQLCDNSPARGYASDGGDCGPYSGDYPYVPGGLIVTNDGLPKLNVSVTKTEVSEGDTFTLTVKADSIPEEAVTLMLTCDNSVRFDFPSKLVLPAGETTVSTTVTVIDDKDIAQTQSAAFTISAEGYESGEAIVLVNDNDMPHIELELAPTAVMANAGANAIMGTVKRSDHLDSKVTIVLSDDTDGLLTYSSNQITLERGVTEAHFTINTNGNISSSREANITASVFVKTCNCPAEAQSGGSMSKTLMLLAGEGAVMTIEPLTTDFASESDNNGFVITLESPAQQDIEINVNSDFDKYLDYQHTVTIHAGETSVTVPVSRKDGEYIPEGQIITYTATANGYATAACWAVATEDSMPDAVITSFAVNATEAEAGSEMELTIVVKNNGSRQLSEDTSVKVTLSDGSYPVMLKTGSALNTAESITITTKYQLPLLTGDYVFLVTVNPAGNVEEAITANNMSQEIPITIKPNYQVTAATYKTTYGQGEAITVTGKATGTGSAFAEVEVYFINDDMRQTVTAKTDAEGYYSAVFLPLDGTSGHFVIGACFPGEKKTDAMAEADVFGLTLESYHTKCQLGQGTSYNGTITVSNLGEKPQTGIRVDQQDAPIGCTFTFPVINKIDAGETLEIPYTITANNDSPTGTKRMNVSIKSNEGAQTEHVIDYSIEPSKGCLKTDSTSIIMTMTQGVTREFPLTIWNEGLAPTGTINLTLPNWIQSVTPQQLPSLASGDSVTVILRILPNNMYLNIAKTGHIGMNCTDGTGLSLDLKVTPISEKNGTFTIDVVDEFYFCTKEKPHVSGAKIQVVNRSTQAIVAEGYTNAEGRFTADIPEGWYRLKISADYHESYDEYLLIDPGTNKTKRVVLSFNGITTEWKVEETEVEDEYSVETVVKFESQVPPPYIDIIWPKEKPQLGKYFPVTLVNKGLIKFYDAKANITVSSSKYGLEIIGNPEIDSIAAGQAVVLYVKLTSKNGTNLSRMQRRALEEESELEEPSEEDPDFSNDECLGLKGVIEACYDCGGLIVKKYQSAKGFGDCSVDKPYVSGSGTGGGGEWDAPSEPEEFACDIPKFKLVPVKGGNSVLGVATDGSSQVKVVLDGNYETNGLKDFTWEIDPSTNYGELDESTIHQLQGVIYTAPDYFPGGNQTSYKVKLNLTYTIEGEEYPTTIYNAAEIELIRVPVLMVHGLNSDENCWNSMKDFLLVPFFEPFTNTTSYFGKYKPFQLYALDYRDTHNDHFTKNVGKIGDGYKHLITAVEKQHYVVEKIDVVGHSMGGLLTKKYIQSGNHNKFNRVITINTPHGGSQLGNLMNDPKVQFIRDIKSKTRLVPIPKEIDTDYYEEEIAANPNGRLVLRILYDDFLPSGENPQIDDGAVYDLRVGDNDAIKSINEGNTKGVKCHAITTYANLGSTWKKKLLEWVADFLEIPGVFGYNDVQSFLTDLYNGMPNDIIVSGGSQYGGLINNVTTKTGGLSYCHVLSCKNSDVQNRVLELLSSNNDALFADGFGKTGELTYEMEGLTWQKLSTIYKKDDIENWDDLKKDYGAEIAKDLGENWESYFSSNSSTNSRAMTPNNEQSYLTLTHEFTEGDTIMNVNVNAVGDFTNISFGCFYNDELLSLENANEGTVRLPDKIQGNIIVMYEGQRADGSWCGMSDTIAVNTIGNTTMQKLSFNQDSLLIINDEYVSPKVLCTWSDGTVTDVENPTLSVTNGNLAYIEDNKYVYGKNTGHTNLVASYGNLSCSTPLEVYFPDNDDEVEDGNDSGSDRESTCSTVTLSFKQKSVMTRQAFRGTLAVNNNHPSLPLENFKLHVEVRDENGTLATQHEFQINPESLNGDFTGELDFDSGWNLKSGGTGVATVLFIPTRYAAPTEPKRWSFGGTISYIDPFTGLVVTHSLKPVTLTVNPTPVLDFTYFMQRDVIGDDPMTEDITEKSIPAEFALLINNKGNADAKNLKFICKQPQIIDNQKGLLVDFSIKNAQLNGLNKALSLSSNIPIEVGTVSAQTQSYMQWWLNSSLLGHFVDYDVTFDHKTSYGNEELSLIDQVSIHELIRGFTPMSAEQDGPARAFLVNDTEDSNDLPDKIYFTDATQCEVTMASEASISRQSGTGNYLLTVTPTQQGWTYALIDNPISGKAQIKQITRQSDGKDIPVDNVWLTDRTLRDGEVALIENKLHFIGDVTEFGEQFLIVFENQPDQQLKVETYEGTPDEDMAIDEPLAEITVHFNKPINTETFTMDDLTLYHEGTPVDMSTVNISKINNQDFRLNMGTATSHSGYYVLMVNTLSITDSEGFEGESSKEASWVQMKPGEIPVNITDISVAENAIYIEPFAVRIGDEASIEVRVKNEKSFTSYSFEVVLPKGMSIAVDDEGSFDDAVKLSARNSNHTVTTYKLAANKYKVVVASFGLKDVTDNDGIVLTIKAHVADDMTTGTYAVKVQKPLLVDEEGTKFTIGQTVTSVTIEDYLLGDVDSDGVVDLADAVLVISHYVGKPVTKFMAKAADVDGDGHIDLADAVRIISFYVGKIPSLSQKNDLKWSDKEPQ